MSKIKNDAEPKTNWIQRYTENVDIKYLLKHGHLSHKKVRNTTGSRLYLVEVTGLEPAASASRTQRSTKLSHTSELQKILYSDESSLSILFKKNTNFAVMPIFYLRNKLSSLRNGSVIFQQVEEVIASNWALNRTAFVASSCSRRLNSAFCCWNSPRSVFNCSIVLAT